MYQSGQMDRHIQVINVIHNKFTIKNDHTSNTQHFYSLAGRLQIKYTNKQCKVINNTIKLNTSNLTPSCRS